MSEAGVDEELCQSLLASYVSEHSASYPLAIGTDMDSATRSQLVLYLVRTQCKRCNYVNRVLGLFGSQGVEWTIPSRNVQEEWKISAEIGIQF